MASLNPLRVYGDLAFSPASMQGKTGMLRVLYWHAQSSMFGNASAVKVCWCGAVVVAEVIGHRLGGGPAGYWCDEQDRRLLGVGRRLRSDRKRGR